MTDSNTPPNALMLLAPGCAFCPGVLQSLGELIKRGVIGRLEVVNIVSHPEIAQQHGVRSVPWVRIGSFELGGSRTTTELEQWAQRAGTVQGMADYASELLKSGRLDPLRRLIADDERYVDALLHLIGDADTDLHVRVGVAAVFEHLHGDIVLRRRVDALGALTTHAVARVRADACYLLSLTESAAALPYVESLLCDADAEVREIAEETRAALRAASPS